MLSDINHHIARTSDPNNAFKFRILIELDSIVDIPTLQWKHFISAISEELSISADLLPKSQIYFSYEGREVYSTLDGEPLQAKPFIIASAERLAEKGTVKPTAIPKATQKAMLEDPMTTFSFAFDAKEGEGSRSLIRAALYCKDIGGSYEQCLELMQDINSYWSFPMEQDRFNRTIITYVERLYHT
jgi:hypothetical protein